MLPPGGGKVSHLVNLGSSCASDETCNRWNPTWLEPQGRCDQKSKIRVSMVPQKALLSSKFFFIKIGPDTYRCPRVWRWCGGRGGCCRGTSPRRSDTRSYRARPGSRSSGGSSCAPSGCSCARTAYRTPSKKTAGYLVEKRRIVFNGLHTLPGLDIGIITLPETDSNKDSHHSCSWQLGLESESDSVQCEHFCIV